MFILKRDVDIFHNGIYTKILKDYKNIAQRQILDFYKVEYNKDCNCIPKILLPQKQSAPDHWKYSNTHGMLAISEWFRKYFQIRRKGRQTLRELLKGYIYTYVCVYVHICIYVCIHIYTSKHTINIYKYRNMHVVQYIAYILYSTYIVYSMVYSIYAFMCICIYVCTHMYLHINI